MYHYSLFRIFGLDFYLYGFFMGLGIVLCFLFLLYAFSKRKFNEESVGKILGIGVFATAFGIFMAMVFQSMYDFIAHPEKGFVLKTNMTFQGGLIGGVSSFLIVWNLYVFVIAPRAKSTKLLANNMNAGLCDALPIIPIGITIAHSLGRLGCFFAGCCHGAKTDAWYGVYMYARSFGEHTVVVPIQLFECIFLAVLSIAMAVLYFKFKFNCNFGVYAVAYGIWRFFIEMARSDYRGNFVEGITPSQFWSIVMVVVGAGYFFAYKYLFKRFMKHPELQEKEKEKTETETEAAETAE